jgi:hypothetical protein
MIHGQHGVGFTAAESRLQLDDRFTSLAIEALRYLTE